MLIWYFMVWYFVLFVENMLNIPIKIFQSDKTFSKVELVLIY